MTKNGQASKTIHKQADLNLVRRAQELEALYTTSLQINLQLDLPTLLKSIVARAADLIGTPMGAVYLVRPDGKSLEVAVSHNLPERYIGTVLQYGEGLAGQIAVDGKPFMVDDYQLWEGKAVVYTGSPFRRALGVPLRIGERIIGVITLTDDNQVGPFSEDDIRLVSLFADQAAIAIENGRLYESSQIELSERKRAEEALRESEARNKAILDAVPDLMFLASRSGEFLNYSSNSPDKFYLQPQDIIGKKIAAIFPPSTAELCLQYIQKTLDTETMQIFEYQLAMEEGIRTYEARLVVSGPNEVLSIVRDITEWKQAEQALKDAQKQLAQRVKELESRTQEITLLTEMSNTLQVCLNPLEAFTVVAQSAAQLFPNTSGALLIQDSAHLWLEPRTSWGQSTKTIPSFMEDDCWAIRRSRSHLVPDTRNGLLCRHISNPPPASTLCVPVMSEGIAVGLFYIETNKNALALGEPHQQLAAAVADQIGLALSNLQLRDNLHEQAIRDPLTTLFNRYYMQESLEHELRRAERSGHSVTLLMVDLDHFKAFNDRYGHLSGDELLRGLGKLLKKMFRAGDILSRYGGDEFLLVLPEASIEIGLQRAEELRQNVKEMLIQIEDYPLENLTISIGISSWPQHGTTSAEVLRAADKALYQAKMQGRDRAIVAESLQDE
ncbi:MAG TPA: diguanylate cyclase [Anaerolineaceae bacterium]|nr:diguanylate cyclase [Anaerolineaceae bacterium]